MTWYEILGIYLAIPLILGCVQFLMKDFLSRIDMLEQQIVKKVDEQQVRQLMTDKIDPLHQDITDVKDQVNQVLQLLLNKANKE